MALTVHPTFLPLEASLRWRRPIQTLLLCSSPSLLFEHTFVHTFLAQSAFNALNRLGPGMKNRIYVVFVNDMGMEETGIGA